MKLPVLDRMIGVAASLRDRIGNITLRATGQLTEERQFAMHCDAAAAVRAGDIGEIEILARRGADLSRPGADYAVHNPQANGATERTLLLLAVELRNEDMVLALLRLGADPKREDPGELLARSLWNEAVVDALLSRGVDPQARHLGAPVVYHWAEQAALYSDTLLARLVAAGADINGALEDEVDGKPVRIPAILCVANQWFITKLEAMLALGADLSATDHHGNTVMHYLMHGDPGIWQAPGEEFEQALRRFPEMIRYLQGKGISIDSTNGAGETLAHCCARGIGEQLTPLFFECRPDLSRRNHAGQTPAELARALDPESAFAAYALAWQAREQMAALHASLTLGGTAGASP